MPPRNERRGRRPTAPASAPEPESDHGAHTLRVVQGEIVGVHRGDVFVDLGPRMQGVVAVSDFEEEPRIGDVHEFTLRGQEEELWVLTLAPRPSEALATWEDMEPGTQVQARVTGAQPEGLELKIGPLHGYLPRSHTGLPRGEDPRQLVGKTLACEVIHVDRDKERVVASRKLVLRREKESERDRRVGALAPGQVVTGRVSRVEPYGAFVKFGRGLEGMVHVSNLSHDRVGHPSEVVEKGQTVEARVLSIKRGGKRIALGLKQMDESPWARIDRVHYEGQVALGRVTRVVDYGAFVAIRRGVEGLLHRSEAALPRDRSPRSAFRGGDVLAVRIVELDVAAERMSLSRLHPDGSLVEAEEAAAREAVEEHLGRAPRAPGEGAAEGAGGPATPSSPAVTNLGRLLGDALRD